MLDVLSDGRVECGVGRGGNPSHFAGFGVPMAESRGRMSEALTLVRRAWTEERFSFDGRFYQARDVALAPRPVQCPHPPIHVAANSDETAEWAGQEGLPLLVASNVNPFAKLRELVPRYRTAYAAAGHAPRAEDLTLVMPVYVAGTRDAVERDVAPSVRQFARNAASVAEPWVAGASDAERPKLQAVLAQLAAMTYTTVNEGSGIFDTPDACVDRLHWVRETFAPSRIVCWFNFGGLIPHDQVMRSMELFAAQVMPRV